ncbi:MAG: hypothetical protein HY313_02310 [Acidobacteria bacterium]|nr:hypothetical protein [Acidobacteriota bacterium]
MYQSNRRLPVTLGTVFGLLLACSIAFAQTKEIEMTVDDPRPMAAAVRKIVEFYGIPINYEGIPVYYSGDLRDLTNLPRGWQLSFSISVEASTGKLRDLQARQGCTFKAHFRL